MRFMLRFMVPPFGCRLSGLTNDMWSKASQTQTRMCETRCPCAGENFHVSWNHLRSLCVHNETWMVDLSTFATRVPLLEQNDDKLRGKSIWDSRERNREETEVRAVVAVNFHAIHQNIVAFSGARPPRLLLRLQRWQSSNCDDVSVNGLWRTFFSFGTRHSFCMCTSRRSFPARNSIWRRGKSVNRTGSGEMSHVFHAENVATRPPPSKE